jgi:alpha-glucosidase
MYFNKYPHRANFAYLSNFDVGSGEGDVGKRRMHVQVASHADDVYQVSVRHAATWEEGDCLETLEVPQPSDRHRLKLDGDGRFTLLGHAGNPLIQSPPGAAFGACGSQSVFQFEVDAGAKFFGLGQKFFGEIEVSGYRTKFWNTDVWSDFHFKQWLDGPSDPPYFSTPYLIARVSDEWVGFLLHNTYPCFFEIPGTDESRVFVEWQRTSNRLIMGSEGGEPHLWILYAHSLRDLTRKLQKLVGATPLPPLWSLGYHQSRWGYAGHDDLLDLDAKFTSSKIPCDALWLDLDYMDGFRIFTATEKAFPKGIEATREALAGSGRRIVPIIDPGVKYDPGYRVYDDGHVKQIFCQNAEGGEFVGLVWPGETVFPDFTTEKARDWWAGFAEEFRNSGFGGCWVDMNDPSTGPVDPTGMLFRDGTREHAYGHNIYALGMQMATKQGFLQARPNERPFVLSRSGYIGSSKNSAIWTGDNLSNEFYLRLTVPTTIGMGLSGLPFNGPDIGGFGGDVTDQLMQDWVKACFLFPLFRNHSALGTRNQEPFAFPKKTMEVVRKYIRLRYKFLPYLYNLFINQEELGDPIVRPLLYEFEGSNLDQVNDEFLIGSSILQAPILGKERTRTVLLPGTDLWYDARNASWLEPGDFETKVAAGETPLFVSAGSILPMQIGTPTSAHKDMHRIAIHLFVPPTWSGDSEYVYRVDDGLSFDYRQGMRSTLHMKLTSVEGNVAVNWEQTTDGYGQIEPMFVVHGRPKTVRVVGERSRKAARATLTGRTLAVDVVNVR